MAFIVALTGGIGSGKSTVANMFAQLSTPIVDADVIARQVVLPGSLALLAISEHFGKEVLLPDGQLNRPMLRQLIFSQPNEKNWLDQLLHPLIQQETQHQFNAITAPYVIWVVPLLIENALQQRADRVLVVDVNQEVQLARTMRRDAVDREHAERILAVQAHRQTRLSHADDIIDSSGTLAAIQAQVFALHQYYLTLIISTKSAGLNNHG